MPLVYIAGPTMTTPKEAAKAAKKAKKAKKKAVIFLTVQSFLTNITFVFVFCVDYKSRQR